MHPKLSMADLLAKSTVKPLKLEKGQKVSGTISKITETEINVDLGGKAEGVIDLKSLPANHQFKVGMVVEAYILQPEEFGNILLTVHQSDFGFRAKDANLARKWQKVSNAMHSNTTLSGEVAEVNKGGLVVNIDSLRGFVPSTMISLSLLKLAAAKGGLEGVIGERVKVNVLEVDPGNNKLVLNLRLEEVNPSLSKFKAGDEVKGKVLAVLPVGIFLEIDGVEGLVLSFEAAWERIEDLNTQFKIGDKVSGVVLGIDESLGRLNISLRAKEKDPFVEAATNFQVDDVVKGKVLEVTQGVKVELEGALGYLPEGVEGKFTVGEETNFLVASIDYKKRLIILAPFITSTKGLIYK